MTGLFFSLEKSFVFGCGSPGDKLLQDANGIDILRNRQPLYPLFKLKRFTKESRYFYFLHDDE